MFEFLTASANMPFTVALAVMLGIALLEGIGTLFGAGLSALLDSLLPELDVDLDADLAGPEIQSPTPLSRLLGWLRIGQVPLLMLLVVFLTSFGLIGLALQSFVNDLTGALLPAGVAVVPAILLAVPLVRVFGGVLGKILPKDETDAVSEDSLVGRIATITLGTAKKGSPAEAKVKDTRGTTHYVMVEPDVDGEALSAGSSVLLVRRAGAVFTAISNPNPALVDNEK